MKNIILCLFCSSLIACWNNDKNCPDLFWLPATLSPIQKEYHVGDTITVISKFPPEVVGWDHKGDERGSFDLSHIVFRPSVALYRIDEDSFTVTSVITGNFDFIENPEYDFQVVIGSTNNELLIGEYNLTNDSFDLMYQLVVLEPGVYFHEFGYWGGDQPLKELNCGEVIFLAELNPGKDSNIELLAESTNSWFNAWITHTEFPKSYSRFQEMGGYVFRVIP